MAARRYVESGDGWRVVATMRGWNAGKYRVTTTRDWLTPEALDELAMALGRAQVAMADRRHPDAVALDNSGDVGRAIRLIQRAATHA